MLTRHLQKTKVIVLAGLLCMQLNAKAQWVKTSGPVGMNVNYFHKFGNNLFAGTSAKGAFRSLDNGVTWQVANTGIENNDVFSLTDDNSFLYAGTNKGVYRSADNGASWQPFNLGIEEKFVKTLYVANGFLYAGTVGSGLFKSSDHAATWTDASGGALSSSTIHAVTYTAPNLVVVADNLIFYSNDNGNSWFYEQTSPFILTGIPALLTIGDSTLLVAGRGVYRSFDAGVHWGNFIPVIPANRQANISGISKAGNLIIAGSRVGIYYSSNFGQTWKNVAATGLRNGSWFDHHFYVSGNNLLLAYDEIGIAYSSNRGKDWGYTLNGFVPAASIDNALSASGNNIISGTHGDGVYQSNDAGNTWIKTGTANNQDTLSNSNIFSVLRLTNNIMLAGTCGNGLYRSTDKGLTWTHITNGLPSGFLCLNGLAKTTTNVLVGTDKGLYYSTDLGISWHASNITGTGFDIVGVAANGNVACAASESIIQSNKIYRSSDNGVTWTSVFETNTSDFASMASDGNNHFYCGTLNSGNLLSNNNGIIWQSVGPGIPAGTGGFATAAAGTNVFIGNNAGVFFSNNSGVSFTAQNSGFDPSPNNAVQGLAISSTHVYAGFFQNSVWKRPLSDFGIGTITNTTTKNDLSVFVTPNPVTNKSMLSYHVEKRAPVVINIYRSNGSLVQSLVSGTQQPGDYTTYITKDKLLPGNYYVSVVIGYNHTAIAITVTK